MKKTFMILSKGTMFMMVILFNGCNNTQQIKKQIDVQNAKIQLAVDAKLDSLQNQVNAECAAKVDSIATVMFSAWKQEQVTKVVKKVIRKRRR